ncbi:hypothetical protein [Corynebacterium guangdongense]|uniref:MFS family permease n=1 Tax=Corynebacterium guangdongense TaxID=1783348 RepID=A0ABU1ZUI7_9CORY|nr:hypothetical protein [Corynebacterium guangdongense]MDR7328592.1 MFS family permease [Corynebacterium guangdongense]WJZ17169.1 hypothetical protein CGUA_02865 [Corynebacterium guangdongense]
MSTHSLLIVGVTLLALGAVAPVTWPALAVVGLLILTVAAYRVRSRTRGMFAGSLVLVATGSATIVGLSLLGGVPAGPSWWLLPVVVLHLVGGVLGALALVRLYRELARTQDRLRLARPLMIVGTVGLVIGLFPQMLPWGVALMALAAHVLGGRRRVLLTWALGVSAVGGMMIMVNYWLAMAGVGRFGSEPGAGLLVAAPYYLGWVLGIVGTVLLYRDAAAAGRVRTVR